MHKIIKFLGTGMAVLLSLLSTLAFADPQLSSSQMKKLIDPIAQSYINEHQIPGMMISIHYNGRDYLLPYGYATDDKKPITKDTIFELASITKVFTTTLLAIDVKNGKMPLNEPIFHYLPALAHTKNLPVDQITVLNLATHTASLPRDPFEMGITKGDYAMLMVRLKAWQPPYPIGTQFLYSNLSFGLLGDVVANAANQSFSDLLTEEVLNPLHMTNTMIDAPASKSAQLAQGHQSDGSPVPHYKPMLVGAGAVQSTGADMLQFLKANLGLPVTSPSLLAAMQFAQQPQFTVKPNFIMGLGWQRMTHNQQLFITKNGMTPGFNTFIGFSPAKKFGVVVLANKKDARAALLGNDILKALAAASAN